MLESDRQAVRERITHLLPDGFAILLALRHARSVSEAEWEELRDWYSEQVEGFYKRFCAAWEALAGDGERYAILRKAGYCHRTGQEMSVLPWERLTPSVKRRVYPWLGRA